MKYDNGTKHDRMQATADKIAGGTLEIGTANMAAVLAVFALPTPAATVDAAGVMTFAGTPLATTGTAAAGAGTNAVAARIKDSGGTARITELTVGAAGSSSNIELDNVSIAQNQAVKINTAAITHAA